MGVCVAVRARHRSALGLHRAPVVQYLRPRSALCSARWLLRCSLASFGRAGSAPLVRFLLGAFAMIGAPALGCPWRSILRLAGGDLNAVVGIAWAGHRHRHRWRLHQERLHVGRSWSDPPDVAGRPMRP